MAAVRKHFYFGPVEKAAREIREQLALARDLLTAGSPPHNARLIIDAALLRLADLPPVPAATYPTPDENGNETGSCCHHAYADGWNDALACVRGDA